MQISFYPNFSRGFTLLEVLIVLFIISLMTGIAVVSLPSFTQSDYFDRESQRIRVLIRMLSEKAITQSNDYGLQINRYGGSGVYGYEFFRYDEEYQEWQPLNESPFKPRKLDLELSLSLRVEGKTFDVFARGAPPVLMLSSGEMTPFELDIRQEKKSGLLKTLNTDGYSDVDWLKQ